MDQAVKLTKAQEPWIGARGRIGVIIPSTNIGVEYDCQRIIPPGVTWHFARFFVAQPDLSSDNMFLAFIEAIRKTIPDAHARHHDLRAELHHDGHVGGDVLGRPRGQRRVRGTAARG